LSKPHLLFIISFVLGFCSSAFGQASVDTIAKRDWLLVNQYRPTQYFFGELFQKGHHQAVLINENEKEMSFSLQFFEWQGKEWKLKNTFTSLSFYHAVEPEITDFNKDGKQDLLIFIGTGARGANMFHYLFLYDRKKSSLIEIEGFEDITTPEYDPKKKLIISTMLSGTVNYEYYKLKGSKVYLVGGESNEREDDGCIRTEYVIKNGKQVITSTKKLSEEECDPFR